MILMRLVHSIPIVIFLAEFSSICQSQDWPYTFKVERDLKEVEKLVIEHLNPKTNKEMAFERFFNTLLKVNVCNLENAIKKEICGEIQQIAYFGFDFVSQADGHLNCRLRTISVRKFPPTVLASNSLPMYECPGLRFRDLETDAVVNLPVVNFVSNSQNAASFFAFHQERPHSPIYPHRYAYQVNFEQLAPVHPSSIAKRAQPFRRTRTRRSEADLSATLNQWANLRALQNPYDKFARTYKLVSVCEMRKACKVSICRVAAKQHPLKFAVDHLGYDESACRRRPMPSHTRLQLQQERHMVPVVKCPALYEPATKKFTLKLLFISATAVSKWLLVYRGQNTGDAELALESTAIYNHFEHCDQDRRRRREIVRPEHMPDPFAERKRLATEMALLTFKPAVLISLERGPTEDHTIAYAKTLTIEGPFTKFRYTYNKITVSELRRTEQEALCSQVLGKEEFFNFKFNWIDIFVELYFRPVRIDIALPLRDAEMLPHKRLVARKCRPVTQNRFIYALSGAIDPGIVVVYVKYELKNPWIPVAFAYNVDADFLKKENPDRHFTPVPIKPTLKSKWVSNSKAVPEIQEEEYYHEWDAK